MMADEIAPTGVAIVVVTAAPWDAATAIAEIATVERAAQRAVPVAEAVAAVPILAAEQSVAVVAIVATLPQVAAVAIAVVAKTAPKDFGFDSHLNRTLDLLLGLGSPSAVSMIQALCLAYQ
jgi:hypothetical protein